MKNILKNSFWQLVIVYSFIILLIALGFFSKYALQFNLLALVIGGIGIFAIKTENPQKQNLINKKLHYSLLIIALIFILAIRVMPYLHNSIPLGYDTGLYKYAIEHGLQNLDKWILQGGMEPGFLYLMSFLKLFLSSQFILTYLLIAFCILLGFSIYLFTKEYFGQLSSIIAILLYSVSIIQFKVFAYMYYKNILALSLMLFSFYFLKKYETNKKISDRILFIIFAVLVAAIHRPTFYILGLSYFFYAFISPYQNKKYSPHILAKNIINGIIILALSSLFYLGKFMPAITSMFSPVLNSIANPGESPGTFLSFFQYQFLTLAYLPFAILGFIILLRKKQFNILLIWTIINASIVYFQFFFFNRFIIHLDIALIILASFSLSLLINEKKKLGIIILVILLFSSSLMIVKESLDSSPLISQAQLNLIQQLNNTETNAYVISLSSEYSPWLLGYSSRKVIAPGLFDYNKWTQEQWNTFWETQDENTTISLMSAYNKPIYLFAGDKSFNNPCFSIYKEEDSNKILKYVC